ncbi:MAG TPA: hypothetical protein VGK99_15990, partial [Acidobacteriota bacterium]
KGCQNRLQNHRYHVILRPLQGRSWFWGTTRGGAQNTRLPLAIFFDRSAVCRLLTWIHQRQKNLCDVAPCG